MKALARAVLFLVSISLLSACHADILYRLDVHSNNTTTLTLRETFDSALYQMALGIGKTDPFGLDDARKAGWSVSQRRLPNGSHVIELRRLIPTAALSNAFAEVVQHMPGTGPIGAPNVEIAKRANFFSDTYSVHAVLPAMIANGRSSKTPFSSMGTAIGESMLGLYFQLRAPGAIMETNGARLKNGYVQWRLNPNAPTPISYVVKAPAVENITGAIIAIILVLIASIAFLIKRRRMSAA